ncbi:hypothetical protein [uncultured Umboniibacter sp.]|uniref:PilW family protein n=1 Tax=uncultured Umboniibacter sp. TaxID=1798917 RepID=UPI0026348F33|nr:hypothetical protein [uncultured Umboniibacter sp.]
MWLLTYRRCHATPTLPAAQKLSTMTGFSLISLLIGMLISALVLTALIDFVLSQNRFAYSLAKSSEQSARQLQLAEQVMASAEQGMNRSCLDFSLPSPLLSPKDPRQEFTVLVPEHKDRAYWQLVSDQVRLYSSRKLEEGDWLVSPYCDGAELAVSEPPLGTRSDGFYRYDLAKCIGQREDCLYRNQQENGELVFLRTQHWQFDNSSGVLKLREHRHPWRLTPTTNPSPSTTAEMFSVLNSAGGATNTISSYSGTWRWAWYEGDWLQWRYHENTVAPQLIAMELANEHEALQLIVGAPTHRRVWPVAGKSKLAQQQVPIYEAELANLEARVDGEV